MSAQPIPIDVIHNCPHCGGHIAEPQFAGVTRLRKDLKLAAAALGDDEARFLVDTYYIMQKTRVRTNNQVKALEKDKEPNEVVKWLVANAEAMERDIKSGLARYSQRFITGKWAESICGVAEVISAGLLANIDIEQAPTVGHIWRFAGLDPSKKWEKKTKRPYNASLKRLCWIIGECFWKVSNNEKDVYGSVIRQRKELEWERNRVGLFSQQAADILRTRDIIKVDTLKWLRGEIDPRIAKWWTAQGYDVSKTPTMKQVEQGIAPDTLAIAGDEKKNIAEVTMEEAFQRLAIFKETVPKMIGTQMLSPAHVHSRAKRFGVKLFLSAWHEVRYFERYGELPRFPYVINRMGHLGYFGIPNTHVVPGLDAAKRAVDLGAVTPPPQ